ncbi:G-protein coupled receptor dmsr-1-like [Penaeus chinensis]|uniref:G-protein coupled receptor dmsr-1-like n=1 Tax=Penaeus chinensis TaxID=139456 RepID=UPI001FB7B66F|nr:G-protein coupled receptor dmsr-1-like [Penaeus chinensis]
MDHGDVSLAELVSQLPKELQQLALNLTPEDTEFFKTLFENRSRPVYVNTSSQAQYNQSKAYQYCHFDFVDWYSGWHSRLALCIALFGAVANILTMTTLTRKNMATPTNLILVGLAVADLMVVLEYVPYAASKLLGGQQLKESWEHALYVLVHAHLSQVCHTISIWLTVSLAVWRWIAVSRPHSAPTFCTLVNARRLLAGVYVACPLLATPTFLIYTVEETEDVSGDNTRTVYKVDFSPLAKAHDNLLKNICLLVFSVLVKLVPCLLLAQIMPAIIRAMWLAKERRQKLTNRKPHQPASVSAANTPSVFARVSRRVKGSAGDEVGGGQGKQPPKKNEGSTERTTSMLLVVMFLFLLTEMPQGLLTGLSLIYGPDFFTDCYMQLADPMDLLALINSTINFVLYCAMSVQFRYTFAGMYCGCCSRRKEALPAPVSSRQNCASSFNI